MTDTPIASRIFVTGASGGLGGALARHYARPGVELVLWGRDHDRLADIAKRCEAAGAIIKVRSLDLTNVTGALRALVEDEAEHGFDLALLCSGRGDVRASGERVEDAAMVAQLGTINFTAPAALAAQLAASMTARRQGAIVLIGSAAAFHALPFAAAYSGTKAGLARFTDALRIAASPYGVRVTLVSPGFIDTAAGRTVSGPKPMLMDVDTVAARIAKAVRRGTAHLVMPWPFIALRWLDRVLPRTLRDRLLRALSPPA